MALVNFQLLYTLVPIQKKLFEKIFFYHIAFNKIFNKLSNDQTYLESVLTPLSNTNNFIKKNLEISQKAVNYEKKQKIKLGILRNDYLLDQRKNFLFLSQYKTSLQISVLILKNFKIIIIILIKNIQKFLLNSKIKKFL